MFNTNTVQPRRPITAAQIQWNLITAMILRDMTLDDHDDDIRNQDTA